MNLPLGFAISTDPARLDMAAVHHYLSEESYWARHIPYPTVAKALTNSLNFGLYDPDGHLAGFARVITDRATFAWLCDVFVLAEFRGRGLSKALVGTVLAHPDLQGLRRHLLATLNAQGLYRQHGFAPLKSPEQWLEIAHPNPYPAPGG